MKKQFLTLRSLGFILLATILIFNSCKKDRDDYPDPTKKWDNSTMTNATFLGQIIKEDGTPLDGATVSTSTHQFITDADGFFYFPKISTPENATLIKVEKASYFEGFRTVRVIPNQDNQVKIMMMELPTAEVLNASTGGTINISTGGAIVFPANGIVDQVTNQPYTGIVNVYAKRINPGSTDLPMVAPGAFRGINTSGAEQGLTMYGTQAVKLVGNAGQKLQLANGSKASLALPIPVNMQGIAPLSIPLWHFDETRGMWVEDGSATKIGNEYVGEVSHFSFWTYGMAFSSINFQCQLVDGSNNPISSSLVKLTTASTAVSTSYSYCYTNSNGVAIGDIPQNATFDLEYHPTGCQWSSTPTFIQSFNSLATNINLGAITVTNSSNPIIITGIVHDCSSNIIANAPVKIKYGVFNIFSTVTNASGAFSLTVNCIGAPTAADVIGYDVSNSVYGTNNITLTPNTTINAGTITACATQFDYITWDVTNPPATTPTTYTMTDPTAFFSQFMLGANTCINGNSGVSAVNFHFDGPQTVAGTHNLLGFGDHIDSTQNTITPALVTLTNYQAIGGQIEGSFSTNVTGAATYNNAAVNCSFRITRQQ